jgi:hypothetical protein
LRDFLALGSGPSAQGHIAGLNVGRRPPVHRHAQGERSKLFAEAPSQFFLKIRPSWTLTFVKQGSKVTRLDIRERGEVMSGRRVY